MEQIYFTEQPFYFVLVDFSDYILIRNIKETFALNWFKLLT